MLRVVHLATCLMVLQCGLCQNTTQRPTVQDEVEASTDATLDLTGLFIVKVSAEQMRLFNRIKAIELTISDIANVFAIASNVAIMLIMQRHRTLSVPQVYMSALALCDFGVGVCAVYKSINDRTQCWPRLYRQICKYTYWTVFGFENSASMSAALIAMFLSIDRCIALRKPFRYHAWCKGRRAKVLSVVIITTNLIFSINYQFRLEVFDDISQDLTRYGMSQYTEFGRNQIYKKMFTIYEFLLRIAIPLIVMTISTTWTLILIRRQNALRRSLATEAKEVPKIKYLTSTVGVVVIFFITHLTRAIYLTDTLINGTKNRGTLITELINILGSFIARLNSIVNIFIYTIFDKEFRRMILELIYCRRPEPKPAVTQFSSVRGVLQK
ncbi:hypothetical protein CAPTEDRAFT_213528 [Capitella teleta]|uniref:G-protein coupled receptors family 1 profile domain-containing protein n=1 Tax=Capitella teleta TaxID=283909 RepID=R7VEP4_CAPTE|nr:hypothetical protein CAPTEDRAFT_213528 [Capitella teleta]|eukprot:ELU17057.1 hypothetical protein CAPTEDRAFT_213528 [Capitella teleta]